MSHFETDIETIQREIAEAAARGELRWVGTGPPDPRRPATVADIERIVTECLREMTPPSEPEVFSIEEAAEFMGVSRKIVKVLVESGELMARNVGTGRDRKRWMIARQAIIAYLTGEEQQAPPRPIRVSSGDAPTEILDGIRERYERGQRRKAK